MQVIETRQLRCVLRPERFQQFFSAEMGSKGLNITGKIILNTGNILSIDDITKRPGQNPSEELVEAINTTIKEYLNENSSATPQADHLLFVTRPKENVGDQINEQGIGDLKINLKIFLTGENHQYLSEAVENVVAQLKINLVDDVVISFKRKQAEEQKDDLDEIKAAWMILEKFVDSGIIKHPGIADIEEGTFRALYDWSKIKPSIIQINLATCCVVPPTLQTFCKENEVKLLTHSDPNDILPDQTVETIFEQNLNLQWALRYTVHIKCRGVLSAKGYVLSLTTPNN